MRRVISVTRRHLEFLYGNPLKRSNQEKAAVMYAPTELPLDTELMLPTTDDSHAGEDID